MVIGYIYMYIYTIYISILNNGTALSNKKYLPTFGSLVENVGKSSEKKRNIFSLMFPLDWYPPVTRYLIINMNFGKYLHKSYIVKPC